MMDDQGYRGLHVWQRSVDLAEAVYELTDLMPSDERYGLASQLHRSSVSISSNIAEGYARSHTGDYLKHLSYARGSLAEVETQLIIAVRVKRVGREDSMKCWDLAQQVGRMLTGLIKSVADGRSSS